MMMLNSKLIGHKIAEARKNSKLSQAELAQKVAISPQAVGKWERGESMPDIIALNKLAQLFGLDLNYFSDSFQTTEIPNNEQNYLDTQRVELTTHQPSKQLKGKWDMSQGNWADADFSGLHNLKEKFSSSNINNCRFGNADLSGLELGSNNIEHCDFTSSEIGNSRIQSSNLLANQFNNCSFKDTTFFKSNVEKCDFSGANFSGAEITEVNFDSNMVDGVIWNSTIFKKTNFSNIIFTGILDNCHFENCAFYGVKFEETTIRNSFFKYNHKFKKVQFINCFVDNITLAFLKNNQANVTGINLIA